MTPTLSTTALVLHTTQYAETSVIAKIFTRQLGVRSYILKGVRKSGSRVKQNLLQPLSYLDLVVYNNPKASINYLKEIAPHTVKAPHISESMGDMAVHNALRFFMTELLYKTLREEEPMPELFDYVVRSSQFEDDADQLSCQPILFMLKVSRFLGIEPLDNYSRQEPFFDLTDGRFRSEGCCTLDKDTSRLLHHYLLSTNRRAPLPRTTLTQRTALINRLLEYFQMHIAEFRNFTSH